MYFAIKEINEESTEVISSSTIKKLNEERKRDAIILEYVNKVNSSLKRNETITSGILPYSKEMTERVMTLTKKREKKAKERLLTTEAGIKFTRSAVKAKAALSIREINDLEKFKRNGRLHLFAMHFEPEMTFMPACGTRFSTQIDIVTYILDKIEPEDTLIIKEHPGQWGLQYLADGGHYLPYPEAYRSQLYYEMITADSRVKIVNHKISTKRILKELDIHLWTVNGSVTLECWLLDREQTILGLYNPWKFIEVKSKKVKEKTKILEEALISRLIKPKDELQIIDQLIGEEYKIGNV